MSILFVLLTFLLVITVTYFLRGKEAPAEVAAWPEIPAPEVVRDRGFEVPKNYAFHPGHAWVLDEGRQNARVGLDAFGSNLLGPVDRLEVVPVNRWVRQGQKLCTLTHEGFSVELLSPIEGVVITVNEQAQRDPSLLSKDPYGNGWICAIKSPELQTNVKNLISGAMVVPWMQHSMKRLTAMTANLGAAAADGGLPMPGVLTKLDADAQKTIAKEFFLA